MTCSPSTVLAVKLTHQPPSLASAQRRVQMHQLHVAGNPGMARMHQLMTDSPLNPPPATTCLAGPTGPRPGVHMTADDLDPVLTLVATGVR